MVSIEDVINYVGDDLDRFMAMIDYAFRDLLAPLSSRPLALRTSPEITRATYPTLCDSTILRFTPSEKSLVKAVLDGVATPQHAIKKLLSDY